MSDELIIEGIGRFPAKLLKEELEKENLEFHDRTPRDDSRFGELTTLTLAAIVAAPLATALAAWLLKTRSGETVKLKIKRKYADGAEEEIEFEHQIKEESEPEADLVKALAQTLKIPVVGQS